MSRTREDGARRRAQDRARRRSTDDSIEAAKAAAAAAAAGATAGALRDGARLPWVRQSEIIVTRARNERAGEATRAVDARCEAVDDVLERVDRRERIAHLEMGARGVAVQRLELEPIGELVVDVGAHAVVGRALAIGQIDREGTGWAVRK